MDDTKLRTRITLTCDVITALGILGSIHLALKHPLNTGPNTRLVRAFYEQLLGKIGDTGAFSPDELAQFWDMKEVDMSRQEAQRRWAEEGKW